MTTWHEGAVPAAGGRSGVEPGHAGHLDVEQRHVGPVLPRRATTASPRSTCATTCMSGLKPEQRASAPRIMP
jgi:hypothetical protein